MKHFPISRAGNKQTDIKFFEKYLPTNNIEIIAECFAGTFSLIRNKYYDCQNILCSDNDLEYRKQLTKIFNNIDDFVLETKYINNLVISCVNNGNKYCYLNDENKIKLSNLKFLDKQTYANRGIVKKLSIFNMDNLKILYDKIKWYDDYNEIFELLKNNEKAFIFLDPPYFCSNNKNYGGGLTYDDDKNIIDNTGMFIDILEFIKIAKCKVMLIINKNKIIEYLFKDFYKGNYNRVYQIAKKKDILNIYCNY